MVLPEYGRNIQNMVDYCVTIEDREERKRCANTIINIMGNMFPHLRDVNDFKHILWDHLAIMSDFKLDVDSPYPRVSRQTLTVRPKKMKYSTNHIMFKHYGKSVERMIRSLEGETNPAVVANTIDNIARYMRAKSYEYNEEHPNNEVIIRDIKTMSGGKIELNESALNNLRSDYKQHFSAHNAKPQQKSAQKNRHQRNQKGNNNRRNYGKQ